MSFEAMSQQQLSQIGIKEGESYLVEYLNKDYYNGEETVERAEGTAVVSAEGIYFNVMDPYGMTKLVMQVRVLS